MRDPRPAPAPRGFTLVEVLVATLIVTVGALALASTAEYLARALRRAAAVTGAVNKARSALEGLRAAPCADSSTVAVGFQLASVSVPLGGRATLDGADVFTLHTGFPCPR